MRATQKSGSPKDARMPTLPNKSMGGIFLLALAWAATAWLAVSCTTSPDNPGPELVLTLDSIDSDIPITSMAGTLKPSGQSVSFVRDSAAGTFRLEGASLPDSGGIDIVVYSGDVIVGEASASWAAGQRAVPVVSVWKREVIAALENDSMTGDTAIYLFRVQWDAGDHGPSDQSLWKGETESDPDSGAVLRLIPEPLGAAVPLDSAWILVSGLDDTLELSLAEGKGYYETDAFSWSKAGLVYAVTFFSGATPIGHGGDDSFPDSQGEALEVFWDRAALDSLTSRGDFPVRVAWYGNIGTEKEVFLFDRDTTIGMNTSGMQVQPPQLSQTMMAWLGGSGNDTEVYVYRNGAKDRLTQNAVGESFLSIWGNSLAWIQSESGSDNEIYLYRNGQQIPITNNTINERSTALSSNVIAWDVSVPLSSTTSGVRVRGASLDSPGSLFPGTDSLYGLKSVATEGSLAWVGSSAIYRYDVSEDTIYRVNVFNNEPREIDAWGDYVTGELEKTVGNDRTIFLWDGRSEEVTILTGRDEAPHEGLSPRIREGKVVWYANDGNDNEIFFWDGTRSVRLTSNQSNDRNPDFTVQHGMDFVTWECADAICLRNLTLDKLDTISIKPWVNAGPVFAVD